MTRLFSIIAFPSGHSQIVVGKVSIGERFENPLWANERCDQLNEMAEAWRVLRAKEEREARKK
jgi:hypothetical protein